MDPELQAKLDHLESVRAYIKQTIAEQGPYATIEFEQPGTPTRTGQKAFALGLPGSPMGSIIGPGAEHGTLRVIYIARELLACIEEHFPS